MVLLSGWLQLQCHIIIINNTFALRDNRNFLDYLTVKLIFQFQTSLVLLTIVCSSRSEVLLLLLLFFQWHNDRGENSMQTIEDVIESRSMFSLSLEPFDTDGASL